MPERRLEVCFVCVLDLALAPKKKDPKKMKKDKVLTFSVKVRQKRKHMTTVAGLELFGTFRKGG